MIAVAAFAVLLAAGVTWLVRTPSGARFAAARAVGLLSPRLAIGGVDGRLIGPLTVTDLRWSDPDAGLDLRVARADVDLVSGALLHGALHVQSAKVQGVTVDLRPAKVKEQPPPTRSPLDPPLPIRIDQLELADVTVTQLDARLTHVRTAALRANWTAEQLAIDALDAVADEGEVHFKGTVAGRDVYRGDGEGRFRWRAADRDWAGNITARASDAVADLALTLAQPVAATLALRLEQHAPWPWTWKLDLPEFDPSRELLPGSSLKRLAAQLEGDGTLDGVTARGRVVLNATPLDIRSLAARREEQRIALTGEVGFGGGRVDLDGALETAKDPLEGRFRVNWSQLTIPADLAGQALATNGRIEISGGVAAYAANGELRIGPPGRLATVQLGLTGTPEEIQLARLDVVQPRGRLAAAGRIRLQPQVGWTVAASAKGFDPGALVPDWPGSLAFRAASNGELREQGPEATLVLRDLDGVLRGRRMAGSADLQLDPDRLVTGHADVSSGASRVSLDARRDPTTGERADARLDVASLGDWWPDARGSLRGDVHAAGRWPDLTIDADLRGSALALEGQSVGTLRLTANVTRPLDPQGQITLNASDLSLGGFDFATLRVDASGSRAGHRASANLTGPRASGSIEIRGVLSAADAPLAWTGTIDALQLAAPDVPQLTLQSPVNAAWSPEKTTLGEACLAGGGARLCAQGEAGPAPQLRARYSVQALPIGLAQAFVTLPLAVEGTLDGEGDLSRDASGAVAGHASLRSASGRIGQPVSKDEPPLELLAWRDLRGEASLEGDVARANLTATLNQDGNLDARGSVAGLTGPAPQVDGQLSLKLAGLGVIETFVPQLLNVQGQLTVDARVSGALDAPAIDGQAQLTGVGFDLPELGLKPREGALTARMGGTGPMQLEGSLKSGDGTVKFGGTAQLDGTASVKVTGERVLAADIPGIKIVMTPDLAVERRTGSTDLTGKVTILSADVNLQRLPSAKKTRSTSPDVVVVDDPDAAAEAARAAPLNAQIDLALGDAVKITGYGLDAKVTGDISVRERPGEPTTASGELRVSGGYKAYGQDLTIDQGQLLYASTPVDNPRLAIVATRKVDTVTAGFRVNGSARNPELTVFSDPAMGQANALSYIVAGKPLDQIGAGTGEGDALQSAARQLGTAAGGLLAKNVGKRLGVDELGIKDSTAIGGAALTVGQYLSPRLYLGYGVGLFDPGQVVMLKYRISRSLSFDAEQGTLNSRAGVEFRKEK